MFRSNVLSDLQKKLLVWLTATVVLTACSSPATVTEPTPPPLAEEITLYNWAEYMPESVLQAFTQETGIRVNYVVYESQEEAAANLQAGEVYDVVVLERDYVPDLIQAGKLAQIDYRHVPNFKNISANFRDLAYDPENKHSIPFHWGTTGILFNREQVTTPIRRWADLWDPRWAGKIVVWPLQRDLFAIALKSLGYSANSENPDELQAALEQLLKLKEVVEFVDTTEASIVPNLASGDSLIGVGWAYDALAARDEGLSVNYILPEEGTFLWGDNFLIPLNSPHKREAEMFLNFVLRPDISAQIVNESYYPMANEAAEPFVLPDLLKDTIVFPPPNDLKNAELVMPLSPKGRQLHEGLWARFLAYTP